VETLPEHAPGLIVEYEPGSISLAQVEITGVAIHGNVLTAAWVGGTPPFQVERSGDLVNWAPVGEKTEEFAYQLPIGDTTEDYLRVRGSSRSPEKSARYRVTWTSTWSAETHPTDFPGAGAHFTGLIGAAHNDQVALWERGGLASPGIKSMAETGSKGALTSEVNAAITAGTTASLLSGSGISTPDQTTLEFDLTTDHPLVSLVCMVAPSPDWFVGVHGMSLFENGRWLETRTIALDSYDAGTDSGLSYRSPNEVTNPPVGISRLTGAPLDVEGQIRPLGTFTFQRLRE
jgi:hypothetical protein